MGRVSCCVEGCWSSRNNGDKLHRFPRNRHKLQIWANFAGPPCSSLADPAKLRGTFGVCTRHFADDQFTTPDRLQLKTTALPSLFPANPLLRSSQVPEPSCVAAPAYVDANVKQEINSCDTHMDDDPLQGPFTDTDIQDKPLKPEMSSNKQNEFNEDLFRSMIRANIPLITLDNKHFREFLNKYTKMDIPSESTLRENYTKPVYNSVINEIRADIGDLPFWLSVEETKDNCCIIVNIIVGKLSLKEIGTPHIILSRLIEDTNHIIVARLIKESLRVLWPQEDKAKNLLLLLTDGAPHMIKAGQALKLFYPKMLRVTCCISALHRLIDEIQSSFPCVNDLFASTEAVFSSGPQQIAVFKEVFRNTRRPQNSVVSSSKLWLDDVLYYADHVDKIRQVIECLVMKVVNIVDALIQPKLTSGLAFVKANFGDLPGKIKKLEEKNIPLSASVEVMKEVQTIVDQIQGSVGVLIRKSYEVEMKETPDWTQVQAVADVVRGNRTGLLLPSNWLAAEISALINCPLTVCQVERTYPQFRTLYLENKQIYSAQNLEQCLVIHCHYSTQYSSTC